MVDGGQAVSPFSPTQLAPQHFEVGFSGRADKRNFMLRFCDQHAVCGAQLKTDLAVERHVHGFFRYREVYFRTRSIRNHERAVRQHVWTDWRDYEGVDARLDDGAAGGK